MGGPKGFVADCPFWDADGVVEGAGMNVPHPLNATALYRPASFAGSSMGDCYIHKQPPVRFVVFYVTVARF